MGKCHELTGIPMECVVLVETEADQSLLVHRSYHAAYRFYDKLIVSDRDTYLYDILAGTLRTQSGTTSRSRTSRQTPPGSSRISSPRCARIVRLSPPVLGLPAIRVLQVVQDTWDAQYGAQSIPGRLVETGMAGREARHH